MVYNYYIYIHMYLHTLMYRGFYWYCIALHWIDYTLKYCIVATFYWDDMDYVHE